MNKKENINQQIEKTLEQFDQAEELAPNPYFYTRVEARLEESRQKRNLLSAVLKPALLTVLLAANLSTAVWYLDGINQAQQTDTHQELVELLSSDFNLDTEQTNLLDIK